MDCQDYQNGSRHLQTASFSGEKDSEVSDAKGNRNSTSFPSGAFSPEATTWWDNPTTVPGAEKGSTSAGYATLYDRLRVSSAFPFFATIYNSDRSKELVLGQLVAFENDGLSLGYSGCNENGMSFSAHYVSTEVNLAGQIRPELCPVGKYGYDPRYDGDWPLIIAENARDVH